MVRNRYKYFNFILRRWTILHPRGSSLWYIVLLKYSSSAIIFNLINNPRMFNGAIVDLAEKPYIQQKILLQWICCKCLAGCYRHSYFWPQRSWRLLEAKNTPQRPKMAWRSQFIEKSFNESCSANSKPP